MDPYLTLPTPTDPLITRLFSKTTTEESTELNIFHRRAVSLDVLNVNRSSTATGNSDEVENGDDVIKVKLDALERILDPVRRSWHDCNNGRVLSVLSDPDDTAGGVKRRRKLKDDNKGPDKGEDQQSEEVPDRMFKYVKTTGFGPTKGSSTFNRVKREILNEQGGHVRATIKGAMKRNAVKCQDAKDGMSYEYSRMDECAKLGKQIKEKGWGLCKVDNGGWGKGKGRIKWDDRVGVDVGIYGGSVVDVDALVGVGLEEEGRIGGEGKIGKVLACKYRSGRWVKGGKFGGKGVLDRLRREFGDEDCYGWVKEECKGEEEEGEWRVKLLDEEEIQEGEVGEDEIIANAILLNVRMAYNEVMREHALNPDMVTERRKDLKGWSIRGSCKDLGRRWRMEFQLKRLLDGVKGVVGVKRVEVRTTSSRGWNVVEIEGGKGVDVAIFGDKGNTGEVKVDGMTFQDVREAVARIEGMIEERK